MMTTWSLISTGKLDIAFGSGEIDLHMMSSEWGMCIAMHQKAKQEPLGKATVAQVLL
jgi:hypothetical protein